MLDIAQLFNICQFSGCKWYCIMGLICIFLITKEGNFYLIHLSTIWIPYSEVPHYMLCLFFLLDYLFLIDGWYSLYFLDTNELLVVCGNYFLSTCGLNFSAFKNVFMLEKAFLLFFPL